MSSNLRMPCGNVAALSHEFMKPLGLSGNALARALRVPANRITGIIKGQRAVTTDTALRLARYFGTSPEFWINMQAGHDLSKARAESGKQIAAEVRAHG
jgi:antitoxin HigA-1